MYDEEEVAERKGWRTCSLFWQVAYVQVSWAFWGDEGRKVPLEQPTSVPQCAGHHQPPEATVMEKDTTFSSIRDICYRDTLSPYLVPKDQSALQQVRGEEREANWWCLQLQKENGESEGGIM